MPHKKIPPYTKGLKENILVIGDLHQPFTLPDYLAFCRDQQEKYKCGTVVVIGDIIDNHAISYHDHDPDGHGPGEELNRAIEAMKGYYHTFPQAKCCVGNHDHLPRRKAITYGLPSKWLRAFAEVMECPKGWDWDWHHTIHGIYFTHGTGVSGEGGAMKIANQNRQSAVIGHLHSKSNIHYSASYKDIIFGMIVGCGIAYKEYAFNYGKDIPAKPIINCGVLLEKGRIPILIPAKL